MSPITSIILLLLIFYFENHCCKMWIMSKHVTYKFLFRPESEKIWVGVTEQKLYLSFDYVCLLNGFSVCSFCKSDEQLEIVYCQTNGWARIE